MLWFSVFWKDTASGIMQEEPKRCNTYESGELLLFILFHFISFHIISLNYIFVCQCELFTQGMVQKLVLLLTAPLSQCPNSDIQHNSPVYYRKIIKADI